MSVRSKSTCKTRLIKLLIFGKIGSYDITGLTESIFKTLLQDFRA